MKHVDAIAYSMNVPKSMAESKGQPSAIKQLSNSNGGAVRGRWHSKS